MAFSVASNYAASFRPMSPAPGFSQVKSDLAANYLMQVPMLRQQMEMSLAKQALAEKGASDRLDMRLDAEKELFDKNLSQSKKAALLALAAQGGSGGQSSKRSSKLNPLQQLVAYDRLQGNLEATDDAREVLQSRRMNEQIRNALADDSAFNQATKAIQGLNTMVSPESILPEQTKIKIQADPQFAEFLGKSIEQAFPR